jgi:hypothetical protein
MISVESEMKRISAAEFGLLLWTVFSMIIVMQVGIMLVFLSATNAASIGIVVAGLAGFGLATFIALRRMWGKPFDLKTHPWWTGVAAGGFTACFAGLLLLLVVPQVLR